MATIISEASPGPQHAMGSTLATRVLRRASAGFPRVLLWLTLDQNGWEQVDPDADPVSMSPGAGGLVGGEGF